MEEKYDAISVFDADNLVSANYLLEMNKQLCKATRLFRDMLTAKILLIHGLHCHTP